MSDRDRTCCDVCGGHVLEAWRRWYDEALRSIGEWSGDAEGAASAQRRWSEEAARSTPAR